MGNSVCSELENHGGISVRTPAASTPHMWVHIQKEEPARKERVEAGVGARDPAACGAACSVLWALAALMVV